MNEFRQYVVVMLSLACLFLLPPAVVYAWLFFSGRGADIGQGEQMRVGVICSVCALTPVVLLGLVLRFWRVQDTSDLCSNCGYDLCGTPGDNERRCPECGCMNDK